MMISMSDVLLKKEIVASRAVIASIGVMSFVLFTALGAYVYIPLGFTPVPLTLQTFFVLLSGVILGGRLGVLSQTIYLSLGMTGLPLFAAGTWGFAHIFGPTGGYLLGFIFAAYVIGKIVSNKDSMASIIIALICGEFIILLSGAAWLWAGFHFNLRQAFYLGVLPFISGDTIKLLAAIFLCKKYIKRAKVLFY